jgi:Fe-S oxidoreductase
MTATATATPAQIAIDRFLDGTGAQVAAWLDACVHCGQCAEACHFYEVSGDPRHTPAYKLLPLSRAYRRHKAPFAWLRRTLGLAPPEVDEAALREWQDLLYDTCTMCGRCTMVCPMGIDISSLVALSRRGMAAAGIGPADLFQAADNSRDEGSPLKVSAEVLADRIEWLSDEHEIDIPLDKPNADILLTVSSIETMKYPDSIVAMARLLNHAGENWTLSLKGYEATNFGVLSGKVDVAKAMLTRIVEAAESVGAKLVVVPECGHAYGALRWTGAALLGRPLPFAVMHITEYLAKLKREGRLKLKPLSGAMTYHDPCQISRRGGATADARYLLSGFAEDFREMKPTGNANWCCGGGGGVAAIASAADLRQKVFAIKVRQVEETGADTMVSACSNCRLTLDEGKANANWDRGIDSLVEIIADHLIEEPAVGS